MAFLLITGAFIYLNSHYKNIFQFDFTPIKKKTIKTSSPISGGAQLTELKSYFQNEFKREFFDSLKVLMVDKRTDTVYASKPDSSALMDSVKSLKLALQQTSEELIKQNDEKKTAKENAKSKEDSIYNAWVEKTSKLYESMDPDKAAKIIGSYSDNVARDIIYSMRKKSAAEILSQFNPETANRITRAK